MADEPENKGRPFWLAVLNSSSVTALVTTLLGGLFASYVTMQYQNKSKEVDRARAETADYLERERKVVEDAFSVTGKLVAASENMIQLTSSAFDERRRSAPELVLLRSKKNEIIENYNTADREWHAQQTTLALRFAIEHQADPGVKAAWKNASDALTDYSDCSRRWFETNAEPVDDNSLSNACVTKRNKLQQNLDSLTNEILRFRQARSQNSGT